MNRRLMGWGSGLLLSTLAGCVSEQQQPQCVVARAVSDGSTGSFAATYALKPGQDTGLACAQLKSEPVGLQKYYSQDPAAPDTVAVRTARVGTLLQTVQVDASRPAQVDSVGALASESPGTDHFCEVPTLEDTRLVGTNDGAAVDLTYTWSHLRIYNTPEIPGTEFIADLRYTQNGCTAEYTVRGIWPVVGCGTKVPGNPKPVPDETKCLPYADPPTRLRGSGINPSFPVKCDPDALICVLTGEVPSVP